ncbi:hypothetical protein OPV22_027348 [Ensete ventricosum]|uniref:Uncharacterized protein n=1 Tax=Ensete ventricosum TaxID=4639 RepID=A0AAV8Q5J0_ENSVE|nr:hypothetical protein OPV22_027348 [Ensete ventricosum]
MAVSAMGGLFFKEMGIDRTPPTASQANHPWQQQSVHVGGQYRLAVGRGQQKKEQKLMLLVFLVRFEYQKVLSCGECAGAADLVLPTFDINLWCSCCVLALGNP